MRGTMDSVRSRARVVLELDTASDPPAGSFRGPDGRVREFNGWLQLAALLEQCRTAIPHRKGDSGSSDGP
jgi:hypothetical protein